MKTLKMPQTLLLQFILYFCLANFSYAQEVISKPRVELSQEMRDLKSEFTNFFNKSMNGDGGMFLNRMIKALENGVISDGQGAAQLNELFSDKAIYPEITNGNQVVKNVGLVPLDGSYWDEKQKLPRVRGSSWYLYFKINDKNEAYNLSLRYMTVKDVYMDWHGK